jgi:hypothetical protein
MKYSSMFRKFLVVPALLSSVSLVADTLILRDGRRIEGRLLSVRDDVVEFDDARGFAGRQRLRLSRDDIIGIQFERGQRSRPPSPPPAFQGGRRSGQRERQVMVAATVRAVDTNIDVQAGQDIFVESSGEVHWGPNRRNGPAGEQNSPMNPQRPMPNRPAAALIGRVGDGSNDYFFIGLDRGPIRMRSSGRLFLAVNDDYLQDNSGALRVIVYY